MILSDAIGFDWDEGNTNKNWIKHRVSNSECEEVFFNVPLIVFPDDVHSGLEKRYYLLGKTNKDRFLFVVFTKRQNKIRIISSRDMSRKERNTYHEKSKEKNT